MVKAVVHMLGAVSDRPVDCELGDLASQHIQVIGSVIDELPLFSEVETIGFVPFDDPTSNVEGIVVSGPDTSVLAHY